MKLVPRPPAPIRPEPRPIGERGKALVRRVAESYLQVYAPDELDEFVAIFNTTYDYLNRPSAQRRVVTVRFGGGVHATTAVPDNSIAAAAIWITQQLVRAVVTAPTEEEISQFLVELVPQLKALTGQPQWVEGIIRTLTEQSAELRSVREEVSKLQDKVAQAERGGLAGRVWANFAQPAPGSGSSPDLLLIISQETIGSGVQLKYQLHTQNYLLGLGHEQFHPDRVGRSPDADIATLLREIEDLLAQGERTGREKAAGIGTRLFEGLVPKDLRRRLWAIHSHMPADDRSAVTLQIVSDASWIPWQLLKLQDPDAGSGEGSGPFLAEAFAMALTLPGLRGELVLPLRKIGLVVAQDSKLQFDAERQMVLALDIGERQVTEVPAHYVEVTETLAAGGHDGWHFAGHGLISAASPDFWSFQLRTGEQLTANDLHGLARGLGRAHPLIFMNICHGAAGGFAFGYVAGLANSFLNVGAGAVIGAHWEIISSSAVTFASAFYRHFFAGTPLGESVRQARLDLRRQSGDPSWLAYAAFGHPLAKCPQ